MNLISNIRDLFMIFLIIGVLCRIDIQQSQNWVSTVAPLYRCLLDKLRQSSIYTISKDAMQTQKTHYTRSYNVWHENALHLMYSVGMKDTLHLDVQCELREECTVFGHTVYFLKRYTAFRYTVRNFEDILHSDVQCEF